MHWLLWSRSQQFSSTVCPLSPVTGSKSTSAGETTVYVDLAYIPSGASSPTVSGDFFRCIRSSCYIVSGDSPEREELLRHTLDALLDSKISWPDATQVENTQKGAQLDSCIETFFLHEMLVVNEPSWKKTSPLRINSVLCVVLTKIKQILSILRAPMSFWSNT